MPENGSFEKALLSVAEGVVESVEFRLLNEEGLFLGVALSSCSDGEREQVLSRLKDAMYSRVRFHGGNRIAVKVRTLRTDADYDRDSLREERGVYPNRVFLFDDRNNVLGPSEKGVYSLDWGAFMKYF